MSFHSAKGSGGHGFVVIGFLYSSAERRVIYETVMNFGAACLPNNRGEYDLSFDDGG